MKPLLFGSSARRLFGIYHEPDDANGGSRQSQAVVLAYPGVHEYNTSHWAFRRLASSLTRAGFHVLRFDYYGTGDSMGNLEEGLPSLWLEDLHEAIAELKDLSGAKRVSLVGLRLGAALAYLACDPKQGIETLCLWEVTVTGSEYLREIERLDESLNLLFLHAERNRGRRDELLGYPCSIAYRAEVEAIRLVDAPPPVAKQVRIFVSQPSPQCSALCEKLRSSGMDCTIECIGREEAPASGAIQTERAMLSNDLIAAICESLSKRGTGQAGTS